MNVRYRIFSAALALALAPLSLSAQGGPPAGPPGPMTPLAMRMVQMDTAIRALRPVVADPAQKDSAIKLATRFETNAKAALSFEPVKKAQVAADSQSIFVEGFKRDLTTLVGMAERLSAALNAGNNAGAAALVDSMAAHQRASHMIYRIRAAGRGGRGGGSY